MPIEWRKEWTAPSLTGVVCFGLGVTVGYIISSRRNKSITRYVTVTETVPVIESESIKEGPIRAESGVEEVSTFVVEAEEVTPMFTTRADDLAEIDMKFTNPEPESKSVFIDVDETWDYEEELKERTSEHPYTIHRDEYFNDEMGYGQSTLTYYEGDEILTDEQDVPIYNPNRVTGPLYFGKGSGDPNLVYVRNEHLEAEYEVIRDQGYYTVEILGHEFETEVSKEKPIIHKFRQD
jgi:hypothetical protein